MPPAGVFAIGQMQGASGLRRAGVSDARRVCCGLPVLPPAGVFWTWANAGGLWGRMEGGGMIGAAPGSSPLSGRV
jgi:hypothetical protein